MINKKNVLGRLALELGVKDAIHVAIVSVRAGKPVAPGQRCGLNEFNEAVPDSTGPGVADPFLKSPVAAGQAFFLLIDQDEIPNVTHVWEHPKVTFAPPTREAQRNKYLECNAEALGVTYDQLMAACAKVVETNDAVLYPGTKPWSEVEDAMCDLRTDIWSEWMDETGYGFENYGTACCPEYTYPDVLFTDGNR